MVLKRLKQKDVEWRRARLDLQKQWKETLNRNYEKSFDHRSFYFRQQDKRSYTAKVLINEIKTMALETGYSPQDFAAAGLSFSVPADKVPLLGNVPISNTPGFVPPLSNWTPQLTMAYSTSYQSVHRDVYRVLCHAAECLVSSPTDKERLPALWRDLLRVFFNLPVHYLYGGSTASYAAYGQSDFVSVDPSEAWPEGTRVVTIYGSGTIMKFNGSDSLYQVQLPFGVGYLVPSAILGAEELSLQALHAIGVTETSSSVSTSGERSSPTAATSTSTSTSKASNPNDNSNNNNSNSSGSDSDNVAAVKDPCQVFFGTHWCYLFFRLHHTIFSRYVRTVQFICSFPCTIFTSTFHHLCYYTYFFLIQFLIFFVMYSHLIFLIFSFPLSSSLIHFFFPLFLTSYFILRSFSIIFSPKFLLCFTYFLCFFIIYFFSPSLLSLSFPSFSSLSFSSLPFPFLPFPFPSLPFPSLYFPFPSFPFPSVPLIPQTLRC